MQDWVACERGAIITNTNSRRRWKWMDFEDVLDLVALEGCFRAWRMEWCGDMSKCFI